MNRKLYVGNLPYGTTELELQTLFATAGNVASVQLIRERETGRARGFAFVEMATDADARNAITNLNDAEFGGRNLLVNEARPQPVGGGFGRTRGNRRW
jgi:RNA recognition motif-containing protein